MLEVRLLGPLELRCDDVVVPVAASSQRRLLVRLALAGPSGVTADVLCEDLALSAGALRTSLSRLRKVLGTALKSAESRYVLTRVGTDGDRFEQALASITETDAESQIAGLDMALGWWRGAALDEWADQPWAQPIAVRLEELRASARERRASAKLAVGRYLEAITEARSLLADHPIRDEPRAVLIRALAATGRRTEALRAFQEYRTFLIEEVGTEPGGALVALDAHIAAALEAAPGRRDHAIDGPGRLPFRSTSFIGREPEIAEAIGELSRHRLVTLTGVGGVGKTRLALEVAALVADDFPDGVWMVELAELTDAEALPVAVSTQLGLVTHASSSPSLGLTNALAGRRALIVLDNCEHVVESAARLAETMLARTTSISVLATSRQPLAVDGEQILAVPPLAAHGAGSAAVRLFVERARAIDVRFTTDDAASEVIADICTRLDGLALAIELAAARMISMGPVDLRDRLDDRFELLAGGHGGVARHQTLRHAVQWSYDLLNERDRLMLEHCSIFAGGFDLAGAAAIANELDQIDVIEAIDSLVRKSLLTLDRGSGRARYSMLETIRQFAAERLGSDGSRAMVRDRFTSFYAGEAERMWVIWASPDQVEAYRWFHRELANLRAAFETAVADGDLDAASSIASRSVLIGAYSQVFEPADWCERVLPMAERARHPALRDLYLGASFCSFSGHRIDDALAYGQAGLAITDPADLTPAFYVGLTGMSIAHIFQGRGDRYLELARRYRDVNGDLVGHGWISDVYMLSTLGHADEAMTLADDMLARALARGIPWTMCFAHAAFGKAFSGSADGRAGWALRRAVQIAAESDNWLFHAAFLRELAGYEASHGSPRAALDWIGQAVESHHASGDVGNLHWTFGFLVVLLARIGRDAEAATMLGIAERHGATLALVIDLDDTAAVLRATLGDQAFATLARDGQRLDTAQSVAYAREQIRVAKSEPDLSIPTCPDR